MITKEPAAQIPLGPLILGVAGLIPFVWGVATMQLPDLGLWAQMTLGGRFAGPYVQLSYGTIVLAFMSGVLWGFATKGDDWSSYGLSVIPALWAFFMVGNGPVTAAVNLVIGFLALLALDYHFWQQRLAPQWWMRLRLLLTGIVIITLLPVIF